MKKTPATLENRVANLEERHFNEDLAARIRSEVSKQGGGQESSSAPLLLVAFGLGIIAGFSFFKIIRYT